MNERADVYLFVRSACTTARKIRAIIETKLCSLDVAKIVVTPNRMARHFLSPRSCQFILQLVSSSAPRGSRRKNPLGFPPPPVPSLTSILFKISRSSRRQTAEFQKSLKLVNQYAADQRSSSRTVTIRQDHRREPQPHIRF